MWCMGLEARQFGLLPEQNWEVDVDVVEALADSYSVAMVIITQETNVDMCILISIYPR